MKLFSSGVRYSGVIKSAVIHWMGFLCIFFSTELGLYYFTKSYQHSEANWKTVLLKLYMQEHYSGFPTSLWDKDYCFCASMGHFNPPLMKQIECFQGGLFVTLLCRNQVNNSLDLGDFANEYSKSVTKRKKSRNRKLEDSYSRFGE